MRAGLFLPTVFTLGDTYLFIFALSTRTFLPQPSSPYLPAQVPAMPSKSIPPQHRHVDETGPSRRSRSRGRRSCCCRDHRLWRRHCRYDHAAYRHQHSARVVSQHAHGASHLRTNTAAPTSCDTTLAYHHSQPGQHHQHSMCARVPVVGSPEVPSPRAEWTGLGRDPRRSETGEHKSSVEFRSPRDRRAVCFREYPSKSSYESWKPKRSEDAGRKSWVTSGRYGVITSRRWIANSTKLFLRSALKKTRLSTTPARCVTRGFYADFVVAGVLCLVLCSEALLGRSTVK